ncbi:MAG: hypothetical protein ABEJ23_02965 [Haloarculaceae archaeon]
MSARSISDRIPVLPGAVAGVVAWLLGYLFTYVLTSSAIRSSPVRQVAEFLGASLPTWKVVGWVFFNAHFSATTFQGLFDGARNFVGGENGFSAVLFLVPPLLLLVAGVAVGRAAAADHDATDAVLAGLAVVPAYFVLSVVGVFLFAVQRAGPDPVTGVFLAGLVYPAVFGVAGAVVAAWTYSGRATSSPQGSNP